MTNRQRVKTPRRIKDWANAEFLDEGLAASAPSKRDLLATYYLGRGVNSVPGLTVMRIIGHMAVKCNTTGGTIDTRFGIRVTDKDVDVTDMPKPFQDNASWLWQERILDANLGASIGGTNIVNWHRIDMDVGSRRRLKAVDDRLWFYSFNDDATDAISVTYSLRVLLALP